MNPAPPKGRPWVGALASLLVPGAGLYLSGQRRAGLAWFLSLVGLGRVSDALAPLPWLPGLWSAWILGAAGLVGWLVMMIKSWRPLPRVGLAKWLGVLAVGPAWFFGTGWLSDRLVWFMNMPTHSMEPTIHGIASGSEGGSAPGETVMVQPTAYWFVSPARGDIVVFRSDGMPELLPGVPYLKRVIGLPGETIHFRDGRLVVNGAIAINPPSVARLRFDSPLRADVRFGGKDDYQIPQDGYFVVGDNTTNSFDSRFWGSVPRSNIIGRATKVCWPLGSVRNL